MTATTGGGTLYLGIAQGLREELFSGESQLWSGRQAGYLWGLLFRLSRSDRLISGSRLGSTVGLAGVCVQLYVCVGVLHAHGKTRSLGARPMWWGPITPLPAGD